MKIRGTTRHRVRAATAALPALALGAALALVGPGAQPAAAARVDNPYVGAQAYVNPQWSARAAAEPGGDAIADQPSFVWMDRIAAITGPGEAMGLTEHLDAALAQGANLFEVVIYDLPGRDCSALASNGELEAEELDRYKNEYIAPIADILDDPKYASLRIVALIEPDSLPNMVTNAGSEAGATDACRRMKELGNYEKGVGHALNTLGDIPNVYNYIDAGHHGWLGWDTNLGPAAAEFKKAATTEGATVADVHGFIVNTANYNATKEPFFKITDSVNGTTVRDTNWVDWNQYIDEQSYALGLRTALLGQGFDPGIGMLIDTARSGWGGSARPSGPGPTTSPDAYVDGSRLDRRIHTGNWCNQTGAGIGERPTTAPAANIDAYVWAKPPGESDGNSQPIDNDEGKGFDRMCDPTYEGNDRNGNNPTGAMPNSPLAGHWFPAQFQMLVQNAYPPLDGGPGNPDDTTAPTVPTGLQVTGTTSSTAALSWTASTDDTAVTAYDIFRDGAQVGSTAGTSFSDTGLAATTTYAYSVRARDAAGNVSARSAEVDATTTAGGPGPSGGVKVLYKNNDSSATDNGIRMGLQLTNTGSTTINLSTVKVRYWFSGDSGATTFSTWCDWAQIGCGSLTHGVIANASPQPGADRYLEVGFSGGTLAAGASTGEIQLRLNKTDWSNFNEADDYSRTTATAYADAPRIGAYTSGTLAWGTAP